MPTRPRFSLVQLEAIIDAVPTGLVICAPDGRVMAMNRVALAMHGMASSEEIMRRGGDFSSVFEAVLPDGTPVPATDWPGVRVARGDAVPEMELRIRRRDSGLEFTGLYSTTPIHDPDGSVMLVVISIQDISEARRADEGLRQRDLWLSAALAASDTGTFWWTIASGAFEADHGLSRLLGYSPATLAELEARIAPASQGAVAAGFRACAERGHELALEAAIAAPDGAERWLAFRGRVLRDAGGRTVAVTGTCSDVTARRQLEARLRLMERAESVGRLAGGVAHEVNNQMSVILGCADFVLRHDGLSPEVRGDVEQMRLAGERSAAITAQLLAFSRRQVLRPELVDLNTAIRAIAPALERTMGEERHVRLHLDPAGATVRADIGQLHQVLINLTLNARDATPHGGELRIETTRVTLGPEYVRLHSDVEVRAGRYALLAVSDTGRGMSRVTRERAFEPFFTTKETGDGTGLGLSTVYGIVKQSGGYVWVYSEEGQGTVFKIYLPLAEAAPEAPAGRAPAPAPSRASGVVLVVEDEPGVRAMAVRALREAGYSVRAADCAAAGLREVVAAGASLTCIVTDVIMPDLDGRTFARQVAERWDGPVLFMSGYTETDIVLRGLLQEQLPFLQKPFPPQRLVEAVGQLVTGRAGQP